MGWRAWYGRKVLYEMAAFEDWWVSLEMLAVSSERLDWLKRIKGSVTYVKVKKPFHVNSFTFLKLQAFMMKCCDLQRLTPQVLDLHLQQFNSIQLYSTQCEHHRMDFFSLAPVDLEFLRRKQPADNLIPPDMTQITIIIQKVILLKNNPWAASKCTNETKQRTERFDKQRRHSGTNKAWTEVQHGGSHIWNEHNTSENLFLLLFLGEGEDSCFVFFF